MRGFAFDLHVAAFACFRKPYATGFLDSYKIPPLTTIFGMLSNALGLPRNNFILQDHIRIGIRNKGNLDSIIELASLFKMPRDYFKEDQVTEGEYVSYLRRNFFNGRKDQDLTDEEILARAEKKLKDASATPRATPYRAATSPIKRQLILCPYYRIFVASDENRWIEAVFNGVVNPHRPLYLGNTESLAIVEHTGEIEELTEETGHECMSIAKGLHFGGITDKVPKAFHWDSNKKTFELEYTELLTIFEEYPAKLIQDTILYRFGEDRVQLL